MQENPNEMTNTESKHDKFVRLAETRTNKIMDLIRLLRNCSNTATYEYSHDEVERIFQAIESEIKETKKSFQRVGKKNKKFSLS